MRCPVSYRACITNLTSLYIFTSCFAFDTATTSIVKRWICNTDAKKSYLNFFLVFGFCGGSIGGVGFGFVQGAEPGPQPPASTLDHQPFGQFFAVLIATGGRVLVVAGDRDRDGDAVGKNILHVLQFFILLYSSCVQKKESILSAPDPGAAIVPGSGGG